MLIKNYNLSIFFSIFFFLLLSCTQNAVKSSSDDTAQKPIKVSDNNKLPYRPSRTLLHDLLHTKLELSFDWEKQLVLGNATLNFKPYFYPQRNLKLDAKAFEIHDIRLIFQDIDQQVSYTYDNEIIEIDLGREFTKADTFQIFIDYTARPNEFEGKEEKGLYFINPTGKEANKPRQIWTQGETENNSKWFPTIDAPNERCTQEMYITADTSFAILSNGELIYTLDNGDGTKTAYWKQDKPHAPYLFMIAIGEYAIIEDRFEDLQLSYYVEPEYAQYAKSIFGNTPEMIKYFSGLLKVEFPWDKYAQVVVRDYTSGAMENTSATVFMEELQVDDNELLDHNWDNIIAHELFHQWFGNYVTCESWANLALNEAFANYSEYLWQEYKYGRDEAERHMHEELSAYLEESEDSQKPVIRYHYKDQEEMFDAHSYNKGGAILHMLRNYTGDEAFFQALNLYLSNNKFSSVEIHDLRMSFEEITGEDLNWFFNQWFLTPGHPILEVSHKYEQGKLKVLVNQKENIFKLPLRLDYWVNSQQHSLPVVIKNQSEIFEIELDSAPDLVVLDPEYQLLGLINHKKTKEEWSFQYHNYPSYSAKQVALSKVFEPNPADKKFGQNSKFLDPAIRSILMAALNDDFWAIRAMAINQFQKYFIPDNDIYISQFKKMAFQDPNTKVRGKAIQMLASIDAPLYLDVYMEGLKEKSYNIAGAALYGFLLSGDTSTDTDLSYFESNNNLQIVQAFGEYYIEKRVEGKFQWFVDKISEMNEKNIYYVVSLLGEYSITVLPPSVRPQAKAYFEKLMKSSHNDYTKALARNYFYQL